MATLTAVGPRPATGTTQKRPRELPNPAPATITVGGLTAQRVAQTPDMVRYVVTIAGKPTYIDLMSKFAPGTALGAPPGFLEGRRAVVSTDRDGVLNRAGIFLNRPDDVSKAAMIPSALKGTRALNEAGVGLVLATNQGGYQTGKMSFEDVVGINMKIAERVAHAGGRLDAIVIAPFNDAAQGLAQGVIDARKPAPGMPLHIKAMAASASVPATIMVGDQRTDGAAGQRAGMTFLAITDTRSGRWQAELEQAKKRGEELPTLDERPGRMKRVRTFGEAARAILKRLSSTPPADVFSPAPAAQTRRAAAPVA
jgi:D-glycero-D-manno-heptose 1,7-bisphosphate phosphatase